ncbi:MAG: hypothetical protein ACRBBP_04465 [Bdellovibrionales bacterium]
MGMIRFFILVSIFSSTAWGINHQEEIAKAQKWANSFQRSYPIFIIDRDKTNFFAKSLNSSKDPMTGLAKIQQYFKEEANISLSEQDFITLEPYIKILTNTAIAIPITKGFKGEYKFCAVFANAPNGNSQVESNRIIGFNQPEVFKDHQHLNYNNLNQKMSFEELYLFSLYHEVSHCLDEKFIVEMQANGGEPHGIHEAEAYAELLAYFALVPRLGKEVAARRGIYRTVYSRVVGEFLTTAPVFGNPHITSGGATYNLGPYLLKAQELLQFQELNLDHPLDQTAQNFVLEHAMTSREFHAVVTFLRDGREKANAQYSDWALKDPHFFYSSYIELLQYQGYTDTVLEQAFTTNPTPTYELLPKLDEALLCQALQNKDQLGYLNILDDYRSLINNNIYEPNEITKIYTKLNNLDLSCDTI